MHMGERLFNALLAMLIVSNVAVTIMSTVPGVYEVYGPSIRAFDLSCTVVFGLKYAARLYVTPLRPGYEGGWRGIPR